MLIDLNTFWADWLLMGRRSGKLTLLPSSLSSKTRTARSSRSGTSSLTSPEPRRLSVRVLPFLHPCLRMSFLGISLPIRLASHPYLPPRIAMLILPSIALFERFLRRKAGNLD
jgi:hypothetical protein